MSAGNPPLAVSLGDPAGIGPEVILKAWAAANSAQLQPFVVCGGASVLRGRAELLGWDCPIVEVDRFADGSGAFADSLPVLRIGETHAEDSAGKPDDNGARLALASLDRGIDLALSGEALALVTAPVAKAALNAIGHDFPGQTEYLATRSGLQADRAVMMLAGPSVRTVPLTVHCALADVPRRLTTDLILTRARIAAASLTRDFAIEHPRLAVTGLNPHAGEDGTFGSEERDIIEPAIERLRDEGLAVSGPHAADALFAPHKRNGFDVAICMYHDQALIPVKALDFDQGVNVTLGLPFVRTSPDHGTAFDIAGRGIADPGAMIAALQMAQSCAANRSRRSA